MADDIGNIENQDDHINTNENQDENGEQHIHLATDGPAHLSGMYQEWFLDYASYVILERAVPHINDGLKPVQRRILHSMKRMDDGRYNKVANIIGHTMQFHPHGDASIGDALVQLGQKELMIDTQGNWGNVYTGDNAAAPRYIEARLSKFALDVAFSPKVTQWKPSYDGRNKEPVTLPVKFPLLLAQGVEGIAVGLASKILPHNFNELIAGAIAYLKGEEFELYPDFQTGGFIDVSRYNDGLRGGAVKVRAKISKLDNRTLLIQDIPYGKNTSTLIESILKANDKGKIKIKKVDDNTAENVEILVHLASGTSSDKTIDALYAFSDCELSISPNCCVIEDNKPRFMGVSEVLKSNVDHAKEVLMRELEVKKHELEEAWHALSLEKIFIEERIYKDKGYENAKDKGAAIAHIDKRLEPFKEKFIREITAEDIEKLFEIKMGRILKFNADKATDRLLAIEEEIKAVERDIKNIVGFTIDWFKKIKSKYGKNFPRKTEIRNFENIEASKVVVANEKLYVNYSEGFIGTTLKKDEFVCNCSDIDDVIIFFKDGRYFVTKVQEKQFVGKDILYISIFKRNDKRTTYNVIYRDGRSGNYMKKRFNVTSITRDKEYDLTRGTKGSRILYFSANPNGEAEVVKVMLKPKPRLRSLVFEMDFSELDIKGRNATGNILTKNDVHKISLKEKGVSTLGGRNIYFDHDVNRLNSDKRGQYLGEFQGEDLILVVTREGEYYNTNFDLTNHYDDDILLVEKFMEDKVWSVALWDADQGYYYIKRFTFDQTMKKQSFIGENEASKVLLLTDDKYPQFIVSFGGKDAEKEDLVIDVDEFIAVKSFRAKGKRASTNNVSKIKQGESLQKDPEEDDNDKDDPEPDGLTHDNGEGQMSLF
jgi:topoisomerase IV subunit A